MSAPMQVILASQSPYRRAQLTQFGLNFHSHTPRVDEEELKSQGPKDLPELTRFLAEQKARSLIFDFPTALLLGSDQIVEFNGQRLDKPGDHAKAQAQLEVLSGHEHRLITSLALLFGGRTLLYTDTTVVRLKKLSPALIHAYLELDTPFDCAGSYKIEKAGMGLIDEVRTQDASAIQGLPLLSLVRGLSELGIALETLWQPT